MALLDSESFGSLLTATDYTTDGLFTLTGSSPGTLSLYLNGPLNDNALAMTSGNGVLARVVPGSPSTFYHGVRMNVNGQAYAGETLVIIKDSTGAEQYRLNFTLSSGSFSVVRTGSVTIGTSAAGVIPSNGFFYFEIGGTISSTVGTVIVRVNGSTVLNLSGVNNFGGSAANVGSIGYGAHNGAATPLLIAHLYTCDGTGSANNTFLGDVRVQYLPPASNATDVFTPQTGSVSYTPQSGGVSTNSSNTIYFTQVRAPASGTLTGLAIYSNSAVSGNFQMAIYSDNNGLPGTLLASSATVLNVGVGTNSFSITGGPTILAYTYYWVAINSDAISSYRPNSTSLCNAATQSRTYVSGYPSTAAASASGVAGIAVTVTVATTTNYGIAGDINPSSSGTYNQSNNLNDQDTFNISALASTLNTIYAVNVKALGKKLDAGNRSIAMVAVSGGTSSYGSNVALSTSLKVINSIYAVDPNTSAAWTTSAVNAINIGYKITV